MEAAAERINIMYANMLQIFIDTLNFTVLFMKEDDGSFTGTVEELDLFENSLSKKAV